MKFSFLNIDRKKFLVVLSSLLLIIIVASAFYSRQVTKKSVQNTPITTATTDPLAQKCQNNSVKEFGQVARAHDILVYDTSCVSKVYANNGTDSLVRFYVRDAAGTFNRRLYSVFNTPTVQKDSLSYAELAGTNQDVLQIHRVTGEDDKVFVNLSGQTISNPTKLEQDDTARNFKLAPNSQTVAFTRLVGDQYTKIEVMNLQSGQSKVYDFPEAGIDGVFPAAWSADSSTLYVSGGIYEFSAPAQLWQINITTQVVTKYQGIDKYNYPSPVFPEDNVALISSQHIGDGIPEPTDATLFALSLSTGKLSPIVTEHAAIAFEGLLKIGSHYIYSNSDGQNQTSAKYKQLDLLAKTSTALPKLDGIIFSQSSKDEGWLAGQDTKAGQFVINYLDSGKQTLIGKSGNQPGMSVPTDNTEYISELIGVIKGKK